MMLLAGVLLLIAGSVVVGIQERQVFAATAVAASLSVIALALCRRPATPTESLIARLTGWGAFWLMLGLILDPLDGGTKKVPETLAWFFQGTGIAVFLMVIFTIVSDRIRQPRWLRLLAANGQNPMIAYVGNGMLILPILGLTGIKNAVDSLELVPWLAFLWSVAVTLLVALTVGFFVRCRLLWRS